MQHIQLISSVWVQAYNEITTWLRLGSNMWVSVQSSFDRVKTRLGQKSAFAFTGKFANCVVSCWLSFDKVKTRSVQTYAFVCPWVILCKTHETLCILTHAVCFHIHFNGCFVVHLTNWIHCNCFLTISSKLQQSELVFLLSELKHKTNCNKCLRLGSKMWVSVQSSFDRVKTHWCKNVHSCSRANLQIWLCLADWVLTRSKLDRCRHTHSCSHELFCTERMKHFGCQLTHARLHINCNGWFVLNLTNGTHCNSFLTIKYKMQPV